MKGGKTWAEKRRGRFYNPSANEFRCYQEQKSRVEKQSKWKVSLSEFFLDFFGQNCFEYYFSVFVLGESFEYIVLDLGDLLTYTPQISILNSNISKQENPPSP